MWKGLGCPAYGCKRNGKIVRRSRIWHEWIDRHFDDELVWRLLKTVRVINEAKIEILFQSGIMMTQRINFDGGNGELCGA